MSHAPRPRGPTYGFLAARAAEELEDDEQLDLMNPDYRLRAARYVEERERARVREDWDMMWESWMDEVDRETTKDEASGVFRRPMEPPATVVQMSPGALAAAKAHHTGRRVA